VVRNEVKVAVKGARGAIAEKDAAKSTESVKLASKARNKAASQGVISKRAPSRRIGRLAPAAHRASAQASSPPPAPAAPDRSGVHSGSCRAAEPGPHLRRPIVF